jgi:hypothetical protein
MRVIYGDANKFIRDMRISLRRNYVDVLKTDHGKKLDSILESYEAFTTRSGDRKLLEMNFANFMASIFVKVADPNFDHVEFESDRRLAVPEIIVEEVGKAF